MREQDDLSATAVTSAAAPRVSRDGPPLIRAEGIWKIFGPHAERVLGIDGRRPAARASSARRRAASIAVRDVSIEVWPGRGLRRHGALRLGQVDARADADPADRAHGGRDRDRRPRRDGGRPRRAARAAPAHGLDGLPALRPARPPARDRQRRLRPRDPGRAEGRAARARRARCCSSSGSRTPATSSRTSSRAACSSASGSRARSRSTRR